MPTTSSPASDSATDSRTPTEQLRPEAEETLPYRRGRLSYGMRIFIPTAIMVWMLMGGLLIYQYTREASYRADAVKLHLNIINNYVVAAESKGAALHPILDFLKQYVHNTPYSDVRLTVYDAEGRMIDFIGAPIPETLAGVDLREEQRRLEQDPGYSVADDLPTDRLLHYAMAWAPDGSIYVRSGMPDNVTLTDAFSITRGWWIFVIVLGLFCTLVVWLATRMLSRNIRLMRDFAQRANSGEPLDRFYEFPHDELGDISRQIVGLYRARSAAIAEGEREHRVALHAVEEKARIKNQLTNNINHELKTPIGVIKGYVDTILADPEMPEATRRSFLERTQANVDRLCLMLNDLSTITRLEDGGEKIPIAEVDFHDLVYQIHADFKAAGGDTGLRFSYDIPLDCRVRGNATVLSSLLGNLVRNAQLHSHGTEISLRLIGFNDNFYIFSFADDGVGVPAESLPHLFERFYRVDKGRSRKAGGSGLGLPIVKKSVVLLGGAISVRNRSTGGLEFIFTLPRL